MAKQLHTYLEVENFPEPFQSGFRPQHDTEIALVTLHGDLLREPNRQECSLLVPLDFSVAFDTVNHSILLDRLSEVEIGGLALS